MTGRRFIDTNVVVYAYDSSAGAKQATAQQVLREAAASGEDVISVQVLGEFFQVTAKLSGCVRVLSEDLSAGQDYDGLIVINPFAVSAP